MKSSVTEFLMPDLWLTETLLMVCYFACFMFLSNKIPLPVPPATKDEWKFYLYVKEEIILIIGLFRNSFKGVP